MDYPIAPPPYKKQAGRPKMKRTKEAGETSKPPPAPIDKSKMPRTYTKMTCQVCFKKGHNKLGCPVTKAKKAAAAQQRVSPTIGFVYSIKCGKKKICINH